jgi:hypothetical protein
MSRNVSICAPTESSRSARSSYPGTLGLLAQRIGQLSEQIRYVDARLARIVECHAPQLLDVVGIGPTQPSRC